MKKMKRLLAMLLLFVMMLSLYKPMEAQAASYVTVTSGQTYSLPKSSSAYIYTVKLTAASLVEFSWSGNSNDYAYVALYSNSAATNRIQSINISGASGSDGVALEKGTYYISMYDFKQTTSVKITTTPVSKLNKANYTKGKAATLKKNTNVKIPQAQSQGYTRWYKIKLTKNQKITLTTNRSAYQYIDIYTSKMTKVKMADIKSPYTTYVTTDKQAKGTYYIRVSEDRSYYSGLLAGPYIRLKWK